MLGMHSWEERLKAHPLLRERFDALLGIVEDTSGDLDKADEAEQRVIEQTRQLGNELLRAWATAKEADKRQQARQGEIPVKGHGKKTLVAIDVWDRRD